MWAQRCAGRASEDLGAPLRRPGACGPMRGHGRRTVARQWWGCSEQNDQLLQAGRAAWKSRSRSRALEVREGGLHCAQAQTWTGYEDAAWGV